MKSRSRHPHKAVKAIFAFTAFSVSGSSIVFRKRIEIPIVLTFSILFESFHFQRKLENFPFLPERVEKIGLSETQNPIHVS